MKLLTKAIFFKILLLVLIASALHVHAANDENPAKAIGFLGLGASVSARPLLQEHALVHQSSLASQLLADLDTAESAFADIYLPGEAIAIALEPGDTLSKIASEYLGNPFLFYALAKYNNIDNPSKLSVDQIIKVPASERALNRRLQHLYMQGKMFPIFNKRLETYQDTRQFLAFLDENTGKIVRIILRVKDSLVNDKGSTCGPVFSEYPAEVGGEPQFATGTQICFQNDHGDYGADGDFDAFIRRGKYFEHFVDEHGERIVRGTFFITGAIDRGRMGVWTMGLVPINPEQQL